MKKSKIIFAVAVGVAIVLCAVLLLSKDSPSNVPSSEETTSFTTTGPDTPNVSDATTDNIGTESVPTEEDTIASDGPASSEATADTVPTETKPIILAPDFITTTLPTDHIADTLPSSSGFYKNDRTVSIDIYDAATRKTYTISFGLVNDAESAFLCLNPAITPTDKTFTFCLNFSCGAGEVVSISGNADGEEIYSFYRTLDDAVPATYQNSAAPGTIWYTTDRNLQQTWIDVRVYRSCCDMFATLRLTIKRDTSGAYYLAGIENLNMLDEGVESELTSAELDYLLSLYETDVRNTENIYCAVPESSLIQRKYMCCQWRDSGLGTYYDYFTTKGKQVVYCDRSDYSDKPVIAITLRFHLASRMIMTVYYQVEQMPTQDSHGVYTFIGFDPWSFSTKEELGRLMYPGYKTYNFN